MVNDDSVNVNNAANRTYRKMTEEPVAALVIKLGIPTMLSMLVTALYSTASTYYVSYLGTSAVGAMGVNFALQTVIQAIGIMIGQGCASQTSRLLGAKNYVRANALASSGLFLSLIFLLSASMKKGKSLGRTTAAATTGPASGPLPASSVPQIISSSQISKSMFSISFPNAIINGSFFQGGPIVPKIT